MELDWYLRRQSGVISCPQARAAGPSQDVVDRRVASRRWERLHPGVYLAVDHPYTDEVRMRAAVLWAGKDTVAHGVSAAWWHDLGSTLPATVEVTVPRRRNPGRQPGVSVRQGRRGSAATARLLAVAAGRAASHAERLLVRLLRAAQVTGWKLGYPVHGYLVDVAFPAQRVAIEVDGWAWHMTADRFVDDRRRQNTVVNLHWTVLRFTWHDLVDLVPTVWSTRSGPLSRPLSDRCFGRTNRDVRGSAFRNSDHRSGTSVATVRRRGGIWPTGGT